MRIRHLSCFTAALIVAPALVILPVDTPVAGADATPVGTSERRVELVAPASAAVGDGDVTTTRDVGLARTQALQAGATAATVAAPTVLEVSPPQAVPTDLAIVGVTYGTRPGPGTVAQYRTKPATGDWEEWQPVDSDPATSDTVAAGAPAAPAATEAENATTATAPTTGRAGSDPIVVTGAAQVQVRVMGPAGSTLPDARLSIIDPGSAAADSRVGTSAPGQAQAAASMPVIHTRKEWGANESWRKEPAAYTPPVKGVIVHHTAGTNNYSPSQVPAILRGIYAFHTKDRGWNDIAYHVMVDKWGRLWEGRAGGLNRSVMGAHASAWNDHTFGVSVLGDYNKTSVSDAAVRGLERVIAWKAGVHGFNPNGWTYLKGKWVRVIQGHKDVGNTTCPGTSLYSRLPEIRRDAAELASGRVTSSGGGSVSVSTRPTAGLAMSDVLMRSSSSALFRSSPIGQTNVSFASRMGDGDWSGYDRVLSAGDLTGDRRGDVLARQRGTGQLHLYRGTSAGELSGPRNLGAGWGGYSIFTGGGDLTSDGKPDLLAVNARTGHLTLFKGTGSGPFAAPVSLGRGWGGFRHVVALGDWDGDRFGDVLAVAADGSATIYRGNGRGGFLGRTKLASSFGRWSTLVGMPGTKALLGVDASGNGTMIRRHGLTTVRTSAVTPNFRGLTVFGG